MHRVELKAMSPLAKARLNKVPNAPCGVESCQPTTLRQRSEGS